MKLRQLLLGLVAVLTYSSGFSQDEKAKTILDELSAKTKKYNTITSSFSFSLDDEAADVHQTQEGVLKMKGDQYYIQLGENHIYCDGQTRWTYNEDMNEVYIDFAETGDDALNPTEIYTVWETGFKHYYDKEVSLDGKAMHLIKLNPIRPDEKAFHTVKLYIDKAKMEVAKIEILGKQGDNYTYLVKSFKPDLPYTSSNFTFAAADHPGVDMIDNR
jgi:outer membrane lipoprotein-sorting protein